jgi:two-component system sensor histidine kinase RegB
VLKPKQAWWICLVSIVAYTNLILLDIREHFNHFPDNYKTHLVGMWLNYIVSSGVICLFVSRLIGALHRQEKTITDYREKNLKNEQLIGLATVAASAVHNLATPLSTLKLYVDDLHNHSEDKARDNTEDFLKMAEQIHRCQTCIHELAMLAQKSDVRENVELERLVADIKNHYALMYPDIALDIVSDFKRTDSILCTPMLHYALINLINNALESAHEDVNVSISGLDADLYIRISNSTDESRENLMAKWGSPSISTKQTGLGIGSMLANTTIEQHSGSVEIRVSPKNSDPSINEICVEIRIPLNK